MSKQPTIRSVTYSRGLVDHIDEVSGLKTTCFQGETLTPQILEALFENDLLSAGGVYGIPDVGEPIQLDRLTIEHDAGVVDITLYNRAIMLFHTDDEIYRRIHRVCCKIENL